MTVGVENTAHNDNTTVIGDTSATVAGFTITNANALCVTISFLRIGITAPTGVTATWDSGGTNQLMTQVAHATDTGLDAYIFGLLAPTTGSHTLSVTWTNNADFGIGVVGLTGVTQTSIAAAFVNPTTNIGTGTTASVAIPTSVNSGVIGIAVDNDPTSTAGNVSNTVLLLGDGVVANNAGDFVSNYQIPSNATTVTLSYTLGVSNWVYAGISIATPVKLEWGFEQYNQYQSPYSTVKNTHRGSGVKGRSGFGIFKNPFREGWQIEPPQPPFRPSVRQRSASFSHLEEGIEARYRSFFPTGWEIQPPQPPTKPPRLKGSILKGIDGIEGRYLQFKPTGWEIHPFQPSNYPTTPRKSAGALSHPEDGIEGLFNFTPVGWEIQVHQPPAYPTVKQKYSGTKGKTTAAVYTNIIPYGWEIQPPQPPFFLKTNQKIGALSQWEDGIEFPFVFVSATPVRWGYDFQQPPLKVSYRSGAWSQKTEGIEARYNNFIPYSWEIQPPPPPHKFVEKRGSILRGVDGIEGTLKNFFPSGWEIQPPQPPAFPKTNQKIAALSQWEDGIEKPFVFVPLVQRNWSFDIQQPPLKINYRSGAWSQWEDGVEAPYNNFIPSGWEIQSIQPPIFPKINQRYDALSHPEEGIEANLVVVANLNWGFELQSGWQPPYWIKNNQKIGALSQWEDGIEGLYVFVAPAQPIWSWDIQTEQLISTPTNRQKYSGIRGKSGFGIFIDLQPYGWEIQPWQPPAFPKTSNKIGALSHPEEGIEAKFIFVAPTIVKWGYEIQSSHLLPRYLPNARSVPNSGDDGIQAPLINFHPYGWEILPPQPPAFLKTNQKIGALSQWEDGIEAKFVFVAPPTFAWSFDIQQIVYKINYYKGGAWSQWEDGIEFPAAPPVPIVYGWEIQSPLLQTFTRVNQRGPAIKGKSEFAIYSVWVNSGWEIQPYQPPNFLKTKQKSGALSHPEEGIEAKYVFVGINWGFELPHYQYKHTISNRYPALEGTSEFASFTYQPYGWEIQPYQPPYFLKTSQKLGAVSQYEDGIEAPFIFVSPVVNVWGYDFQQPPLKVTYNRSGAWSQWEDGIEKPFVFVAPVTVKWGYDIQPTISKINYRAGAWSQWEDGIEFPFINFHPYGWEIPSPQPPAFPKINQKIGATSQWEDGIEKPFTFIAPVTVKWGYDFQQPPLKINYRSGAWSQREDGIEKPLINFFPFGWEVQPPQPPNPIKVNIKYGALSHPEEGIEGVYVPPPPPPPVAHEWGFEFQTPWQPPNFPRARQRGPAIKGKSEFAIYSPWINGGWEIQPYQPPNFLKTKQRSGVLAPIGGTEGKFIFVAPITIKWGWEQPPHLKQLYNKHFGIEGANEFASFTFQPSGWEIQPYQPPNPLRPNKKQGALSEFEDGSESKFVFVAPVTVKWGYDIQQPPLKINYRSGAWSQWEDGIEFPLNIFFPYGWEIQPPQPPHPKPEVRAAAILKGIDSVEYPFIRFFPLGWEVQPPQPPFFPKTNRKIGATSQWEDGIEKPFVFVAPLFFTDAWEIQPFQPRHTFIERRGAHLRGIDGIEFPLRRFFPGGWEIQSPPPPFFLKTRQKIGATSQWEDGIEGVYVFVPPPVVPQGWDPNLPLIPYWLRLNGKLWGALSQWEDGIEGVYVFVPPPIPPIPPQPPPTLGPISNLNFRDMHTLGLAPSSNLYWDYGNTEDFYVLDNTTNALHRVSPRFAFGWYATTPSATTIYNPFLARILSGESFTLSDDDEN